MITEKVRGNQNLCEKSQPFLFVMLLLFLLSGCGKEEIPPESSEVQSSEIQSSETLSLEEYPRLAYIPEADLDILPEIKVPSFEEAMKSGDAEEWEGSLPGAAPGTWYTITLDGVEFYFGTWNSGETMNYYGYSIVSSNHVLNCGIQVGMHEEDALSIYPDLAVMNFDNTYLSEPKLGSLALAWNSVAYPDEWKSASDVIEWHEQFDYIIIGEIDNGIDDDLPYCLGLLITDHIIKAITVYAPTAG